MKREGFLEPLATAHHDALMVCRLVQQEAEKIQDRAEGNIRNQFSAKAANYLQSGLEPHLQAEEKMLERLAVHCGDKDADVRRMRSDHRRLRELAAEGSLEALVRLSQELHDHIHFEQTRLFPRLKKTLTFAEKQAVAAESVKTLFPSLSGEGPHKGLA